MNSNSNSNSTSQLFSVPQNNFGIIGMHCPDGIPIPPENLVDFFNGPMRLVHELTLNDCGAEVSF